MKKSKIILAAVLAAAIALTGCSSKEESSASSSASESVTSTAASTAESSAAEDSDSSAASDVSTAESAATAEADDENYNTGDASLDNPRNQDEIGDNELLVLSFGTSFNDSRRLTIGAIENDLETAFPGYSVRRGFTANIVIDHVYKRDGEKIDDIGESLDRAVANGVKNLVVQPTHLMNGIEYDELCGKIADYSDAFEKVVIGDPLLTSDEDPHGFLREVVLADNSTAGGGKLRREFVRVVLHVREVHVNVALQRPERFHSLVPSGVVHHRDIQPALHHVQRPDYLRDEGRGADEIYVPGSPVLQFQEYFREPFCGDVLPEAAGADIVVLAEYAAHDAPGKEHGAASPGHVRAADTRFLPLMERRPGDAHSALHAAESHIVHAVGAAFPRA